MRTFETGATRDSDDDKIDYDGFLSHTVLIQYEEWLEEYRNYAWAAGLFEGEGCVTIVKQKSRIRRDGTPCRPEGYRYPRLCMSLTDEDVLRRFAVIMGGTIRGPYCNAKNRKPIWNWQASGDDALRGATLLFPFLGNRRLKRLIEVFGPIKSAIAAGFDPTALNAYCKYMHLHRLQADGQLRASDNWKKGIPFSAYMKSMFRHFMDVWARHQDGAHSASDLDALENALCALMFNVQGYLHELIKLRKEIREIKNEE